MVSEPRSLIVGTTPVRAVHSLKKRTSLAIANTHVTAKLYYGKSNQVTISSGMVIMPETTAIFLQGLGDRPDHEYWLIADTDGVDVRIDESTSDNHVNKSLGEV